MGKQLNDHGPLGRADEQDYCEAPRFSVIPNVLPRLAYEAQLHADSVRIYAERLTRQLDAVIAHAIPRDQMQSVADTIADAQRALADASAKLARLA